MTKLFSPTPNHPALPALLKLHANLGGQILENKKQATKLAQDMKHVEAVIQMFDPDYSVRAISARRRVTGNPWFKRGTLFREALSVMRAAPESLTVTEIAAAMLTAKGVKDPTRKQRSGIEAGVPSSLENHAGKTVERVGEGVPRRWRLKG